MDVSALHAAIAAVAPICGVSIGDVADRATWRIQFDAEATSLQRQDAANVLVAWVDPPPVLSFLEFIALFTPTEQSAAVSSTVPQVKLAMLMASGAVKIHLTHPKVAQGLDAMISAGIISSERKTQILANQHPL